MDDAIKIIQDIEKKLNPLFDDAIAARDAAQRVSSAINKLRMELTQLELGITEGMLSMLRQDDKS